MQEATIKLGTVYEDCFLHPVYCTESDGDDIAGISLFDGSGPRSCSIRHCGIRPLDTEEVIALVDRRKEYLEAEETWRKALGQSITEEDAAQATTTYYETVNRLRQEEGLPTHF